MVLLLDSFDSFTYNLVDYFEQLDIRCEVVRNDVSLEKIHSLNPSAIVLSPGPEVPAKSGCLMEIIGSYYESLPMLGVCLGHQALGQFFGMRLVRASKPRHGKITQIRTFKHRLFQNLPEKYKVVQYNSLILEKTRASPMKVIAESDNGEIMAISHEKLPLWGVHFHPEAALTEYGIQLLKNLIDYNNIR